MIKNQSKPLPSWKASCKTLSYIHFYSLSRSKAAFSKNLTKITYFKFPVQTLEKGFICLRCYLWLSFKRWRNTVSRKVKLCEHIYLFSDSFLFKGFRYIQITEKFPCFNFQIVFGHLLQIVFTSLVLSFWWIGSNMHLLLDLTQSFQLTCTKSIQLTWPMTWQLPNKST